jgi:hypothetical protein
MPLTDLVIRSASSTPKAVVLSKIPLEVLLRNVMVNAVNTALHDRKVSLYSVGMHITTNVFADAVIDRVMQTKATGRRSHRQAFSVYT